MQILHPFVGSIQQYSDELSDPDRYRPDRCPQCEVNRPLAAHGFYTRNLMDVAFDGSIRIRRYLCRCCMRTVSLLLEFALPYLRFGITVVALFLITRLLGGSTLSAAVVAAMLPGMPYQRGQFWVRRRGQAERLCAALAALVAPPSAPPFVSRAVGVDRSPGTRLNALGPSSVTRFSRTFHQEFTERPVPLSGIDSLL